MNRGRQHSRSQSQIFVEDLIDRYKVQTQIPLLTDARAAVEPLLLKDVNYDHNTDMTN